MEDLYLKDLSVLLGNQWLGKLSTQDATTSRNHWVEPTSKARMEPGLNGTIHCHWAQDDVSYQEIKLLKLVVFLQDGSSSQILKNALREGGD